MKKKEDIACLNCGKLFHAKRKESKFCCRACGIQYNTEHGIFKKTDEQRERLSKAKLGKEPWNKGKKASAETIAKFKESIKNVWTDEKRNEQRIKQKEVWSDPLLKAKHSTVMKESSGREEVREKISASMKEYNASLTEEEWTRRYMKAQNTKKEHNVLYESSGEKSLREFVESLGFTASKFVGGKGNTRFEIDCYIEDKKIGIEYNGIYYHAVNGGNKKKIAYHFNKQCYAQELGIDLIQVWEDQWKNQNEIIKDIIAARLGVIRGNRIYARNCIIKDVSTADYREFCNLYHVQGYRSASVKLGLYYNGELVQIASFNKARTYGNNAVDKYEWEWIRGCISSNNKVIGGTSKLLKYFIDNYNPNSILCFSDWNLFNGKGYEESGFTFVGMTGPDKFYITNNTKLERINRNPYAYQYNKQLVAQGKLFECHGCGSKKFVWYKE